MNFNFDKKSLILGIATGFSVAMLVLFITTLVIKNKELKTNNQSLRTQIEFQKMNDIPLTKVNETNYNDTKEIVYEETTKLEHGIADSEEEEKITNEEPTLEDSNENLLYVKNKHPITIDPSKKLIAIIIDDVGVHVENSKYSAEKLPKEITFAYLPYGHATQEIVKEEFNKNREAMLHLPTEPVSSIDPGPDALYAKMTKEEIQNTTLHNINQLKDYIVGANNHMGSKFTANLKDVEYMLEIINNNGLFFIDSFTTAKTKVKEARDNVTPNMPLLKRNIFLDHKRTNEFINSQLAKVETIAEKKGYAIAIGHPHKITTDNIIKWEQGLAERGFQLVPITAILDFEANKNK